MCYIVLSLATGDHLCVSVFRSSSWLKRGLFGLLVLFLVPVSMKFLLDLIQHFVYTHRGKYLPFSLCQKHCKLLSGQQQFSCLQSGCRSLMTSANLLISPLITQSTCTWPQRRGSLLGFGKLWFIFFLQSKKKKKKGPWFKCFFPTVSGTLSPTDCGTRRRGRTWIGTRKV